MTKHIHPIRPIVDCPSFEKIDANPVQQTGLGHLIIQYSRAITVLVYDDTCDGVEMVDKGVFAILEAAGIISGYRIWETKEGLRRVDVWTEYDVGHPSVDCDQYNVVDFLTKSVPEIEDLLLKTGLEMIKEGQGEGVFVSPDTEDRIEQDLIQESL